MKELVITSLKRWVIVCLVLCFPGVQLYAQNVVNTVRSEQNKTITGVNVDIKGTAQSNHYSLNGWDIDVKNEEILFSNSDLGIVLDKVRLQVKDKNTLTKLGSWHLEKTDSSILILTDNPKKVSWNFRFFKNNIIVSASAKNAFITAIAPCPDNRFPARIAKPEEVLASVTSDSSDYSGVTQTEYYYIPPNNQKVMYLSLGAIDSPNLHALFDKKTNIAIDFPNKAVLKRVPENPSLVSVTVPIEKKEDFLVL